MASKPLKLKRPVDFDRAIKALVEIGPLPSGKKAKRKQTKQKSLTDGKKH